LFKHTEQTQFQQLGIVERFLYGLKKNTGQKLENAI